jgi:protein involved in polysaccharide export with SLBB domain
MVPLNDLDVIKFFSILDIVENIVSIGGNVYQPGEYALSQYPTLKALITDAAKGILVDTYLKKVDVIGLILPEEEIGLTSYNLSDILSGKVNVLLKENDMVTIYSKLQIEGAQEITISGYGIKGGTKNYPWLENQSLYDLIFSNTAFENPDFTTNVLSSRLDLMRLNKATGLYKTQSYNLTNLEQLKKTMLHPYDKVILFNQEVNERINKRVSVGGFVKNTTELSLQEQMYVEDALLLAGGFNELADKDMVYVNREDIDPLTENISTLYTVEIDKDYLLGKTDKPSNGFILMDRDIISVRKQLGIEPPTVINLQGEVNYPRSFIGEFEQINYEDLILAGGGLTQNALLAASTVVRDGRLLAIDLSTVNKNQQLFKSGDVVTFAKNRGEVSVSGAIEQENYFIWEADKKAKYYIKNSGGKIRGEADESYVSLPNGKTKKINFFNNPRVLPNSEIVITRKVEKERVRKEDGLTKVLTVATLLVTLLTSVVLVNRL